MIAAPSRRPRVLVFDSGLGGLTVHAEIIKLRPGAECAYVADDARFPYGAMAEEELVARVTRVIDEFRAALRPDLVVIACNTASTLVLPPLRARHPDLPFVGAVPAIKPAAETSRTGLISVLATPGTVARDYTRALIREFAGGVEVELVGAADLAAVAERRLRGEPIDVEIVAESIAPCFVVRGERRTDKVVLACTHFPLIADIMERVAPWPVDFVDPAPAIARRVDRLLAPTWNDAEAAPGLGQAYFTSGRPIPEALQKALRRFRLEASSDQLCAVDA